MSRRFTRHLLLSVLLVSSEVLAIGLGDIKLDSALNEPLRAEIELLSASAEEIAELKVDLASDETFARYGIDRPFFMQSLEFNIRNSGAGRSVVQIRSRVPVTEPFLTFLVEATWPSGRLLREYTVLLDPPTYAPPAVQQPAAVAAPRRTAPSDSGQIQRPAPQPPASAPAESRPEPQPVEPARAATTTPKPQPPAQDLPYDTSGGGDYVVRRGETLWGIAQRMRPDSRLTMNQTMLGIFEANRDAFGGNINMLREGASLRIPSADEVFQISRGDAFGEVERQNNAWATPGSSTADSSDTSTSRPSLTLVPPDEDPVGTTFDDTDVSPEPLSREDEVANRIAELEAADVPDQQSLIEIRDNELASLRQELADIRGEVYEPPFVDDVADVVDDATEVPVDDASSIDDVIADTDTDVVDSGDVDAPTTDIDTAPVDDVTSVVRSADSDQSFVEKAIEFLSGIWGIIIGALLLVIGALFWFMRRGDGEDDSGPWRGLDDEVPSSIGGPMSTTETLQAPVRDDAMVVVEGDSGEHRMLEDTVESPQAAEETSGAFGSLEDTFSSDTAVNLDQTDPIAEADFHMAYGLYDQAADLINGALESDPNDTALMSKLCEIYFVWGNRDAFVDAASRLKASAGGSGSAEWDKIVIMGQQIAADHSLFAGVVGAASAVDMAIDDGAGETAGALDMDFGTSDSEHSNVIDLGESPDETVGGVDLNFDATGDGLDVDFDLEPTAESPTIESSAIEPTVEMPKGAGEDSPTIEEQFSVFDGGTAELPSLDDTLGASEEVSGRDADSTAEINLDDLDLDVSGLAETEIASLDDLDATGQNEALMDTGVNEALLESTGRNPEVDPDSTGVREGLDIAAMEDLDSTGGMRLAVDETGRSPMVDAEHELESTDFGIDDSLLDATGRTQVLSEDLAVAARNLGDDDATMLAPGLDADDDDFDFAKTEALPKSAYEGDATLDETAGGPALGETDVELDLDDLTAALQVSEAGDTVEHIRDEATVEQPRPALSEGTAELPTMSLGPDEMSDDLQEARTMTEVGTKLDLARAYVDMGDPAGARSILEEVLDEGDAGQKQQAQQLLDSLPS